MVVKTLSVLVNKGEKQLRTYITIPKAQTSDFLVGIEVVCFISKSSNAVHLAVPLADILPVPHIVAIEADIIYETPKSAIKGWYKSEMRMFCW